MLSYALVCVRLEASTDEVIMSTKALPTELTAHRILSATQASALLGMSLATFRRAYRRAIVPPPIQIGLRKYGWRASDLVAFLEKKVAEAGIEKAA